MVASRALGEPVDTLAAGVRGRWRFVCSLGLSSVLVVLCSLVHATPPDPLWIPGIYDDADYDDAIVTLVSSSGLIGGVIVAERPVDRPAESALLLVPCACACALRSPVSTRAPPPRTLSFT